MTVLEVASPDRAPETRLADARRLLHVQQLEVTYNRVAIAVQGLSIEVGRGEIVGILGTNGAGKTTLLRAISGFLPSDNAEVSYGDVVFDGDSIRNESPDAVARRGIAIIPERDKVFATLTVADNLAVVPKRGDNEGRERTRALIDEIFPVLGQRFNQLAGFMSGGERQMLAIARTMLLNPQLLLADEISFGIAPILVTQLLSTLKELNRRLGTAVLLVEQNARAALSISDYVYIIENGRVVFDGTPDRLSSHEDVREFYLGLSETSGIKSYAKVKQYKRTRRWWG